MTTLAGFVPHRINNPDNPEHNNFPINILFSSMRVEGDKTISGTALYEPITKPQPTGDNREHLTAIYVNIYDSDSYVIVIYNRIKKSWIANKTVRGKCVSYTTGNEWDGFFIHLTMNGLSNGERCMFKEEDL